MSLAARLDDVVSPQIIDDWVRQSAQDIHARLVRFDDSSLPEVLRTGSSPGSVDFPRTPTVKSGASSMAPALIHQSNASTHPPSLSYFTGTEATPTETSISTGLASHFSGVQLLEENNGVLELRRTPQARLPVFECAFWFLSCNAIFPDKEDWEIHCLSHFRGEEPPRSVQCPLCEWAISCDDGWTAWNLRMQHLAYGHTMLGQTLRTSRPDFHLFQHLWQKRLIDDEDLKELKGGNHNLTHLPGNFILTNGRAGRRHRDGRRHRTQHVAQVRQRAP